MKRANKKLAWYSMMLAGVALPSLIIGAPRAFAQGWIRDRSVLRSGPAILIGT